MCKLCNIADRPAVKTISKANTKLRKEINAIVYDYLGEYACLTCFRSIYGSCKRNGTDIDKAILRKLYNTYKTFSSNKLSAAKNATKMTEKGVLGCTIKIYNRNNGKSTITYTATLRTSENKYFHDKPKNTLEEAILDKIELIKKHKGKKSLDAFLKSIERYNQKLKESQNEQN